MSTANVKAFMKKAKSDKALEAKLQAIQKGGGQSTVAEIVKIADQAGFKFSSDDYEDAINEVLNEKHAAGALNDEELAIVSGGLMCVSSDGSKKCTCCTKPTFTTTTTKAF
jgi:predicted ribosomally synthesized peptide with nif11-like leader